MSLSIGQSHQSAQAQSIVIPNSPNLTHFTDELDSNTSISELRHLCEEAVENIRQIIIHTGAVLKNTRYPQSRLEDIFATPQLVIENNINVLTNVHKEIKTRKIAIKIADNRPFCGTYFTVENVKDFGYRGLDYLAAIVALSLIVLGTSESTTQPQNLAANSKEAITKGSFTAILLVISKCLSAVTDYRNKKKYDREVELNQLSELSYKCKKAKEAKGLLTIIKSITDPSPSDQVASLRRFNLRTIEQLIDDVDDPLDLSSLNLLKKQIRILIDKKITSHLKTKCPSLLTHDDSKLIVRKVFSFWKSFKFDKTVEPFVQETTIFASTDMMTLSPPNLLSLHLPQLPEIQNSL